MNRATRSRTLLLCVLAVAAALLAGCAGPTTTNDGTGSGNGMMGGTTRDSGSDGRGPQGGMMGDTGSGATEYSSDGQRIFLTGVGTNGQDIPRSAPAVSQGALMMGGNGCGSCHSADGRGGTIRMMTGTAVKTPDIRYSALVGEGFTDAAIRRAIRDGLDEAGDPLKEAMPRWQMSDADVDATIAYLKVLDSQ